MDLPVVHSVLALNEPPNVKKFDPPNFTLEVLHKRVEKLPPSVVDVLVGCTTSVNPGFAIGATVAMGSYI
jgi:hypothetical protein